MHKTTILQMIGYGDRTRTQAEVVRLFQEKYPELPPISQGTVSKIEKQFRERGHVRQLKKNHPNKLSDDQKLESPHWMRELHTQNPEKVNVWAGKIGENITGPFFIDGNLNGETYLALLQNNVVPTIANLYPAKETHNTQVMQYGSSRMVTSTYSKYPAISNLSKSGGDEVRRR
ncbi:hypothetical protein NQ318_009747 [Aromia moschata]|uniref:DUF4817 domain-containing protein n=1 Tax=Aromia moschata TaxID=1265417 RepID=A0AAV8Y9A5_9CUCU|nr:hypothetical protein NQ318_009747 [Aromia moschata]